MRCRYLRVDQRLKRPALCHRADIRLCGLDRKGPWSGLQVSFGRAAMVENCAAGDKGLAFGSYNANSWVQCAHPECVRALAIG